MNLSRKTLLYSSILYIIIVSLLVGYFILMLPSLYVSYMQDRNYDSIVTLQKGYMRTGSYQDQEVKNPTGTITLDIPFTGNSIYIVSKFFKLTVDVESQETLVILEKLRYYAKHLDELKSFDIEEFNFDEMKEELLAKQVLDNYPLSFQLEEYDYDNTFQNISSKVHVVSKNLIVYEANVTDGNNYYTSYIAMGTTEHAITITFLPVMSPRIDEIRPVILLSLPMIIAVALLLVVVFSHAFSKQIVFPIIKLANHAEYMKDAKNLKLETITITGKDEISSLAESLNGLYQKIQDSYQELEVKNQYLSEENKRQEVFLRASSHQLKTPITAALLLVQGMINEVGKYKDVKSYLPQVKQQLLSMQKIVEDILFLNHCSNNLTMETISLPELMEECLGSFQVQIEEKSLAITTEGQTLLCESDRELLKKIIDNLLSNAIYYTPENGQVKITYNDYRLSIINYGATIKEDLLPHIFEPFVTSDNANYKAHGLGLYVVAYYAKLLHCQVNIRNMEDGVEAELLFI